MRGACNQHAGRLGYAELEALVVGQAVLIGAVARFDETGARIESTGRRGRWG